ncbi:MAG: hypothetical protein RLZ57_391 [Actinomycetota bacterium]|jgi:pyridoxal phosphate enzyme (YggS family)
MNRREELASNLAIIKSEIPSHVKLIVVTKTFPASDVEILKDLGVEDFGENRDQEGSMKAEKVSATWHFQGQLQSNKLKSICRWANVIHSLDSLRYVNLISKAAVKPLSIFIQVSLEPAEGRGGANPNSLIEIADAVLASEQLALLGLMAVAPLGIEPNQAFAKLAEIHHRFRTSYPDSPYLSAGMSGDYKAAIAHGATHIRVGSSILGSRPPIR